MDAVVLDFGYSVHAGGMLYFDIDMIRQQINKVLYGVFFSINMVRPNVQPKSAYNLYTCYLRPKSVSLVADDEHTVA